MKTILFFAFFAYSFFLSAQTEKMIGQYEMKFEASNGLIIYKLALNLDETFVFHLYSYINQKIEPKDENQYAKGTWKCEKGLIFFSTDSNDLDEKFKLDFNNSKARFISKSPRDQSSRDIKTSIRFYESELSWLKGVTLIKI